MVQRRVAGLVVTVTVDVRLLGDAMVAAPPVTVQVPVSPDAGAFAARVNRLFRHWVCAGPATERVGTTLVSVTVEALEQDPRVIVHRNVAGLVVTVAVVLRVVSEAKVAAPLTTDQVAVSPAAGAFAASVKEDLLHLVCAGPALEVVVTVLVKTTVALTAVQPVRETVQRSVAGEVVTVTVVVGDAVVAMVAAPETTDQAPVLPAGAGVAAITKDALLHLFWAGPAEVDAGHCAQELWIKKGSKTKVQQANHTVRCSHTMLVARGCLYIRSSLWCLSTLLEFLAGIDKRGYAVINGGYSLAFGIFRPVKG
jgi:hypothetical protein